MSIAGIVIGSILMVGVFIWLAWTVWLALTA
jgi:hypothetical protein